jgi:NAD(P)H-hydrate epimerase
VNQSAWTTVAGTGDALSGVIASLIGQGMDLADAGRLGTWILGTAGELAADEWGPG